MADASHKLQRGANIALPEGQLGIRLSFQAGSAAVFGCLLGIAAKIRNGGDVVAIGSPRSSVSELSVRSSTASELLFELEPTKISTDVAKIVFCALADPKQHRKCGSLGLSITVLGTTGTVARYDLTEDDQSGAASVVGELYRRGAGWKFRAVGQGFKDGLEPLATFLGSDLQTLSRALMPPPQPPPTQASAAPVSPTATREVDAGRHPERRTSPASAALRPRPAEAVAPDSGFIDGVFRSGPWVLSERGIAANGGEHERPPIERELLNVRGDHCGLLWPAAFAFQPLDGTALPPAPAEMLTHGRSLGEAGLAELPSVAALDPRSRRDEDVPPGARIFAAGGSPPRLVAVNASDGRAWWKAPISRGWVPIGRCPPPADLPLHASGAVGSQAGVFYAGARSLVHLLPRQRPTFEVIDADGTPVAPPTVLQDLVLLPLNASEGLTILKRQGGGITERSAVDDPAAPSQPLGAAVTDGEAGTAFWIGASGFLTYEADGDGARARWHAWPADVVGLPHLRPYRARNGRLWAFCVETSSGGAVRGRAIACALSTVGSRERKALMGPLLAVGSSSYRVRERFRDPWSAHAEEEINVGLDYPGRWLMPLMRLGSSRTVVGLVDQPAGDAAAVREFVFREGPSATREIALALHSDNGGLDLLGQTYRISSTDDLEMFMDDDRFCILHPESSQCASWSTSSSR